MKFSKQVTYGQGGWCAEFYTDDDNASGYGNNARVGYWYGTREECEKVDISEVVMSPMRYNESPDPFDMMCERRFD